MRDISYLRYAVDSFAAHAAARKARAERIGERVALGLRRVLAAVRRRLDANATYLALSELDSHTLRDLGLDRSEIRSVADEISYAGATRVHARAAWHNLPYPWGNPPTRSHL
jgi:uncharacterized protein YjiS (DUF1127 family)